MIDASIDATLHGIAERLERQFHGNCPLQAVEDIVRGAYEQLLAEARIETHLAALTERAAREQLRASLH